jgi:hypothetical protein
MDGNVKAFG